MPVPATLDEYFARKAKRRDAIKKAKSELDALVGDGLELLTAEDMEALGLSKEAAANEVAVIAVAEDVYSEVSTFDDKAV